MYRIYNEEKKKWCNDIFIAPNGDLYALKKGFLKRERLIPISDEKYIIHRDIDLIDRDGVAIHEGDYIQAKVDEDKIVLGLVVYAHELASYIILCLNSEEYYVLGSDVCEFTKVVGNVFDGYKEVEWDGQQTL